MNSNFNGKLKSSGKRLSKSTKTISSKKMKTSNIDLKGQNKPKEYNSVHVVGIYESRADHSYGNHPIGKTTVKIQDGIPANELPICLVLSSYEPTE